MTSAASIVPAASLLASVMPAPVAGFAPLWFGNQLIGAVSAQWLPRLDPRLFGLEDDGGELPVVRVHGAGRGSEPRPAHADSLGRRFTEWSLALKAQGHLPGWRGEGVRLYGADEAVPLLEVERALVRPLGLMLRTVQVNVFSYQDGGLEVWIARRADSKPVDPGKLDSLVGGGIAADETPVQALLRECREEAGIGRRLARQALPVGVVDSRSVALDDACRVLHRERLALFDLQVPAAFVPTCADGEIAEVQRLSAQRLPALLAAGHWTNEGAFATTDLLRRYAPAALRRTGNTDSPNGRPAPMNGLSRHPG